MSAPDHWSVVQWSIPADIFDAFVEAMHKEGCKVDDVCEVTRYGRTVDVWIPSNLVETRTSDQKVGYFLGEGPPRVCETRGCRILPRKGRRWCPECEEAVQRQSLRFRRKFFYPPAERDGEL